ncbi:uncharacterized protein LOC110620774 isoform X3 [Manihot esculenta]|nr:uncharacterized protein LOC110620774 isoform X3 [Manihot esculenta]
MIGSAVGGTTSAFYGFNHVMPIVRKWIKGPMWLHFLIGSFSTKVLCACAGTTCNSILFSLCWFSRWCCSGASPTCFIFLPCSGVVSFSTSSTRSKDAWLQKFLYFVRETQHNTYKCVVGIRQRFSFTYMLATVLTPRLYNPYLL